MAEVAPRVAGILDYVEASEFRRTLARRVADALLRDLVDESGVRAWLDVVDANELLAMLTNRVSPLVVAGLRDTFNHLVDLGYPPSIPLQIQSGTPVIARYALADVVDRARNLTIDAITDAKATLASFPPGATLTLDATVEALTAGVRAQLRAVAGGLVATAERLALDYAVIEHASKLQRPYYPFSQDELARAWEWFRKAEPGDHVALRELGITGEGWVNRENVVAAGTPVPGFSIADVEIGKPNEAVSYFSGVGRVGVGAPGPFEGYYGVTSGATVPPTGPIMLSPELTKAGFYDSFPHEVGHIEHGALGLRTTEGEIAWEYGENPADRDWMDMDRQFAWQTRYDEKVCDDQFENSCSPRHGWQLAIGEWQLVGLPQSQNLICSLYAKGNTSYCRCQLIPAENADEYPEPIDVSQASKAGREAAAEVDLEDLPTPKPSGEWLPFEEP